jgi:hypothetical protein
MRHIFLLQDHIGGGFIWANEEEVEEVASEAIRQPPSSLP